MQVSVVQFRPWAPSSKFDFDEARYFSDNVSAKEDESTPPTNPG
jgi:hypothetical protein